MAYGKMKGYGKKSRGKKGGGMKGGGMKGGMGHSQGTGAKLGPGQTYVSAAPKAVGKGPFTPT